MLSKFYEKYLCSLNRMCKLNIRPEINSFFFKGGSTYRLTPSIIPSNQRRTLSDVKYENPLIGLMEGLSVSKLGIYNDCFDNVFPHFKSNEKDDIIKVLDSCFKGNNIPKGIYALSPELQYEISKFCYAIYFYQRCESSEVKYELNKVNSLKSKDKIKDITIQNIHKRLNA